MTELLHLENYSFTYPQQRRPALSHVTLTLPEGASWYSAAPPAAENPRCCGS